jgi:hypothetical protein
MKLHISKSLYNYFIMDDIKYFFSIKTIKQFRMDNFFLRKDKLSKALPKNIIFQNSVGVAAPLNPPLPIFAGFGNAIILFPFKERHYF